MVSTLAKADFSVGDNVVVPVKSKYGSKTNITAALIAVFGLATAFNVLPAAVASPEVIGSVVTAGGILVALFRTASKAILK